MSIYLRITMEMIKFLYYSEKLVDVNFGDEYRVMFGGFVALSQLLGAVKEEIPDEIMKEILIVLNSLEVNQRRAVEKATGMQLS